ncbi:MAG: radical SAM protein [Candidatus Altiarchaeota archaeon]
MCYAIPGRVVELNDRVAVVDYFGEHRKVVNEFDNLAVGDYVYAQGGFVVQRVSREAAEETLETWREAFFELQKVDEKLSNVNPPTAGKDFLELMDKASLGRPLSSDEILRLLGSEDDGELKLLYTTANLMRKRNLKNSCCVHGIIEFSNHCRRDCAYCGIRQGNGSLPRYRMTVDEIVDAAGEAVNVHGFKALVLQSGEDSWYSIERLTETIRRIKEECGVLIFMSVGERGRECYRRMYEAGARGVLLRFETSNRELYGRFHPGGKLSDRLKLIRHAADLGYLVATGSLIGLPGQTTEDLMNDILLTKELGAEMHSFGPFIPNPDTPLAGAVPSEVDSVLKVLAVSRLLSPDAKILVTTALETLDPDAARMGLLAGANSLMIKLTPGEYGKNYALYPGIQSNKTTEDRITETLELLYSLGRAPTDLGI